MYGYIYKTTNLANGKIYIGQKKSKKFLGHSYLGSGKVLKQAVEKYGKESFKVELIDTSETKEDLDEKEKYYIELYNATDVSVGYNLASGGSGVPLKGEKHHLYGKHHSVETRRKISISHKGSKAWAKGKTGVYSKEVRESMGAKNKGKHWFTNGSIQVFSFECPEGFTEGRLPMSEESLKKISEHNKGKLVWNKGKKDVYTKETRKRMGEKNIGRKLSEEHKQKIINASKNREYSKGFHISEEQKSKQRLALCYKVSQYTIDGEYIATYNGVREAGKKTNSNPSRISACCRGEIRFSNHFQWRYGDSKENIGATSTSYRKPQKEN